MCFYNNLSIFTMLFGSWIIYHRFSVSDPRHPWKIRHVGLQNRCGKCWKNQLHCQKKNAWHKRKQPQVKFFFFLNETTTLDLGLSRSIQMWKFVSLGHLFIWTLAGTGCQIAAKLQQLIGDCIWCPEDRLRQKRTRNHQQQRPILDTLQTIGEHGSWLARFIYYNIYIHTIMNYVY